MKLGRIVFAPLPTSTVPLAEGMPVPGQKGKKHGATCKYHPGEPALREAIREGFEMGFSEEEMFEHIRYKLWGSGW